MALIEKQTEPIELGRWRQILRRRWCWGAATFTAVVAMTSLGSIAQKPVYQAQARLSLNEVGQASPSAYVENHLGNLSTFSGKGQDQATTVALSRSMPMIQKIIRSLNLKDPEGNLLSSDAFLKQLTIVRLQNSTLLTLTYDSEDPHQAIAVVDRLAQENQSLGNLQVVQAAQLVADPVSPKILWNLGLGMLTGGLLAIAVMLMREAQDRSIKTAAAAQKVLDSELLAIIPEFQTHPESENLSTTGHWQAEYFHALVSRHSPNGLASDAYRDLGHSLQAARASAPSVAPSVNRLQKIVVTSSVPQEGKSTTTANLAWVMAEQGQRVLLIDADLRLPSQYQIWNLPPRPGLSHIIGAGLDPGLGIHPVTDTLDILTAGVLPPNPLDLIDSRRMAALLEHFSQFYDSILIDTPPITVAADPLVLGKIADGVVMVIRPGVVDTATLKAARELLENSQQNLLGAIVNGIALEKLPDHLQNANHTHRPMSSKTPNPSLVS
jgi:capsular exopolysaccharide synthesis family protein